MFSTNQIEIVETLVPTMLSKGYSHYVAYTNTNSNSYYSTEPDIYIIFSSEEISASSAYSYNIPSGSVMCVIRSGNYSTGNTAVNSERIKTEAYTSKTLTVDVYEHIYTNAEFQGITIQPDILQEGRVNTLYDQASLFVLAATLIFLVIAKMWTFRK